jgi:hypothetical protein
MVYVGSCDSTADHLNAGNTIFQFAESRGLAPQWRIYQFGHAGGGLPAEIIGKVIIRLRTMPISHAKTNSQMPEIVDGRYEGC